MQCGAVIACLRMLGQMPFSVLPFTLSFHVRVRSFRSQ
jgi:hypothetical protein